MSAIKYVHVNGTEYPVRYDMNALCEFEEITGNSLINGLKAIDIRSIRAIAYVGLACGHSFKHNGSSFPHSITDVGKWSDLMDKASEFIEVLNESLDVGKKEKNKPEKPGE